MPLPAVTLKHAVREPQIAGFADDGVGCFEPRDLFEDIKAASPRKPLKIPATYQYDLFQERSAT